MTNPDTSSIQAPHRDRWYLNPALAYLLISVPTIVWVSWSAFAFPMSAMLLGGDFWEHSATIREWTRDLWNPGNPHLDIDVGTPRYMPFYFVLAVIAKFLHLDPIRALAVGATLSMILFTIGVWLFFSRYFRNSWASTIGYSILLCGWGVGWLWSNLFQLRDLFFVAAFPSFFVFSISFFAFWLTTVILRQEHNPIRLFLALAVLTGLMLVSHPLTGAFAAGTIALLAVLEPKAPSATRVRILLTIAIGASLTLLWPYFSTIDVILGTSSGENQSWLVRGETSPQARSTMLNHIFYEPRQVFVVLGPALLGIPALVMLAIRRLHLFIVAGFFGTFGLYLANLWFPIPLGWRFLLFSAVFLQLALTWWILDSAPAWRAVFVSRTSTLLSERKILLWGGFIAGIVIWNIALATLQFAGFQILPNKVVTERYTFLQPVQSDMRSITEHLPPDSIVMSSPLLSWPLPTFGVKVVALHHLNPMVPDQRVRRSDVRHFFSKDTTEAARREILDRYGVTHILYSTRGVFFEDILSELNRLGEVAGTHKHYILYRVGRTSLGDAQP